MDLLSDSDEEPGRGRGRGGLAPVAEEEEGGEGQGGMEAEEAFQEASEVGGAGAHWQRGGMGWGRGSHVAGWKPGRA